MLPAFWEISQGEKTKWYFQGGSKTIKLFPKYWLLPQPYQETLNFHFTLLSLTVSRSLAYALSNWWVISWFAYAFDLYRSPRICLLHEELICKFLLLLSFSELIIIAPNYKYLWSLLNWLQDMVLKFSPVNKNNVAIFGDGTRIGDRRVEILGNSRR